MPGGDFLPGAWRQSWNINGIMIFALIPAAAALLAKEANIAVNTAKMPDAPWNWLATVNIQVAA